MIDQTAEYISTTIWRLLGPLLNNVSHLRMMDAPSRKRKLADPAVSCYYAVRAGHQPGVYTTWNECAKNIGGFSGAAFKKFTTESQARDFVAGKASNDIPMNNSGKGKFYAVAVGHEPGVYMEWGEAQKQIQNVEGPRHKKFSTREEAEDYVRNGGRSNEGVALVEGPAKKRPKTEMIDGYNEEESEKDVVTVWTDGSSRGNGKTGAVAGVGVYFGHNDTRNISEPLLGDPQTNNRAELTALIRALETVPKNRPMKILSDSNYSINCVTVWYLGWMQKGWVTSTRKPVENKDLIVRIRDLVDARAAKGAQTVFQWVRGHDNDDGNMQADKLAVEGALRGASQKKR